KNRQCDRAARRRARERGKQDQREPGDQRDDADAAPDEVERVAGKMRAAEKLIERTAQHERKVLRLGGLSRRLFRGYSHDSGHRAPAAEAAFLSAGVSFIACFTSATENT